jgi:hypothetical protein
VPSRLFLTITARSRRLQLLLKIRRLRNDLGQPLETQSLESQPLEPQP